jgi:hypothetical protein
MNISAVVLLSAVFLFAKPAVTKMQSLGAKDTFSMPSTWVCRSGVPHQTCRTRLSGASKSKSFHCKARTSETRSVVAASIW